MVFRCYPTDSLLKRTVNEEVKNKPDGQSHRYGDPGVRGGGDVPLLSLYIKENGFYNLTHSAL